MKKLFISIFVMSLSLLSVAQAYTLIQPTAFFNILQEKVAVKPEDLPEAIKTTLSGDTYAGWQVVSAFLITKEDNSQFFEISMKKGAHFICSIRSLNSMPCSFSSFNTGS